MKISLRLKVAQENSRHKLSSRSSIPSFQSTVVCKLPFPPPPRLQPTVSTSCLRMEACTIKSNQNNSSKMHTFVIKDTSLSTGDISFTIEAGLPELLKQKHPQKLCAHLRGRAEDRGTSSLSEVATAARESPGAHLPLMQTFLVLLCQPECKRALRHHPGTWSLRSRTPPPQTPPGTSTLSGCEQTSPPPGSHRPGTACGQ